MEGGVHAGYRVLVPQGDAVLLESVDGRRTWRQAKIVIAAGNRCLSTSRWRDSGRCADGAKLAKNAGVPWFQRFQPALRLRSARP